MPQTLIVIFLLFFAVLAFGWFYWQRAKARDAEPAAATPAGGDAPATSEQADSTDTTPAS
jgi:predicted negative regulator of RcsB-dependent stress response